MDDYISKPLRTDEVVNVLSRSVLRRQTISVQSATKDPIFDRNALGQLHGIAGAQALIAKVVEIFRDDAPLYVEQLSAALEQKDVRSIQRVAHSLAGTSGTVGGREVRNLALEIEQAAGREDWEFLATKIGLLPQSVDRLQTTLSRFKESMHE